MDFPNFSNNTTTNSQAQVNFPAEIEHNDYAMPAMTDSQYALQQQADPYGAMPYVADYQHHFDGHSHVYMSTPMDHDSSVLGPSGYATSTPPELLHVQNIYDAYVASYKFDTTPDSVRMETAQALALALLSHYYPESEGYIVQPSNLGPVAKHGMNFMLKAPDGVDPDYVPLEPLTFAPIYKDPKKGKKNQKKPPSKARMAQIEKTRALTEYKRQFSSWWPYTTGVTWHQIEPEDICGYEVFKKHTTMHDGVEKTEYPLHTCMAVVLAPPTLLPQIAETNDVHRGDILTDVLSRSRQIRRGYGILLFGTWLELYDFDNGAESKFVPDPAAEEYYDGKVTYEEPRITMYQSADQQRLAIDLRAVGLSTVDEMCRMVVRNDVLRLEEGNGPVDGAVGGEAVLLDEHLPQAPADGFVGPDAVVAANGDAPSFRADGLNEGSTTVWNQGERQGSTL